MPDITIENLRVAPGAGPRVPTYVDAYPLADFLLADGETAVSAQSPYDAGAYFKRVTLTPGAPYYTAADFTLPSTTDSPDNPDGARWGLFVKDALGRLMYPVAGLDSFWLEDSPTTVDAEDIRANMLGTLPAAVPRNVHITGDAEIDGDLDVGGVISGDMSGGTNFPVSVTGPSGLDSTGSITVRGDSDDNTSGALIDVGFGSVGAWTLVQRLSRTLIELFVTLKATLWDKGGTVFNVRAYGAVEGGVTDCTSAFRDAVAAMHTAGGGTLFIPPGRWRVAEGGSNSAVLTFTKGCRVLGCPGSEIYVTALGSGSDVILVDAPGGSYDSLDDMSIERVRIVASTSAKPGRYAIHFRTSAAQSQIKNSLVKRVIVGQRPDGTADGEFGSYAVAYTNPSGDPNAQFTGQIEGGVLYGGVLYSDVSDSHHLIRVQIASLTADRPSVDATFLAGAAGFEMRGCNATAGGGVVMHSGYKPVIADNNIECVNGTLTTAAVTALLNLAGDANEILLPTVEGNTFVGVGLALDAVKVDNVDAAWVNANSHNLTTGRHFMHVTSSANLTTYGFNRPVNLLSGGDGITGAGYTAGDDTLFGYAAKVYRNLIILQEGHFAVTGKVRAQGGFDFGSGNEEIIAAAPTPNGNRTARRGSLYSRQVDANTAQLWFKATDTGGVATNTGWVQIY